MKQFVVIFIVLSLAYSAKLPDYLKKCKKGADGLQCVIDNTMAVINQIKTDGEPKFKLQSLSPVNIKEVELQATPQLKINIKDAELYGLPDLKINKGYMDDEKIMIHATIPSEMTLLGKYIMDGRILILPIRGNGDCNITFSEVDLVYEAKFTKEERKGKKYLQVLNENSELKVENVKRVHFRFDNLFDGDKRLAPEMSRFLDENWQEVFAEVKPALEQVASYAVINYFINGYLHYLPLEDLFA